MWACPLKQSNNLPFRDEETISFILAEKLLIFHYHPDRKNEFPALLYTKSPQEPLHTHKGNHIGPHCTLSSLFSLKRVIKLTQSLINGAQLNSLKSATCMRLIVLELRPSCQVLYMVLAWSFYIFSFPIFMCVHVCVCMFSLCVGTLNMLSWKPKIDVRSIPLSPTFKFSWILLTNSSWLRTTSSPTYIWMCVYLCLCVCVCSWLSPVSVALNCHIDLPLELESHP